MVVNRISVIGGKAVDIRARLIHLFENYILILEDGFIKYVPSAKIVYTELLM